jgi:hypothetical protein
MQVRVQSSTRGASVAADPTGLVSPRALECRVCELETENARLRLLVAELLVVNQRLRETTGAVRAD